MRTSTAEKYNYICPKCGDELKRDHKGRGYVSHKTQNNPYCDFERRMRDSRIGSTGCAPMMRTANGMIGAAG